MEQKFPEDNPTPIMPVEQELKIEQVKPLEPTKNKGGNFLTVFLSILLLISVVIAGLFAYQTQKLVKEIIKLQFTPSPPASTEPSSTIDPTIDWKTYTINLNNLTFKYPSDKEVFADINSLIELRADKEYWIAYEGTDQIFLDISLYKSTKNPIDWWTSEGKNKFENLATMLEKYSNPPTDINLKYEVHNITIAGKEALAVTISSNFESPHTPKINNLIIFQNQGYITTAAYHEISKGSLELSSQILSTFKIIDSGRGCPADAKLCPDGSVVGRSGINCEFAPCPTPNP